MEHHQDYTVFASYSRPDGKRSVPESLHCDGQLTSSKLSLSRSGGFPG